MIEIGHNIRWVADDCEWTIAANDLSNKYKVFHSKLMHSYENMYFDSRSTCFIDYNAS